MENNIKNAFSKVKEDINFLNDEILKLKIVVNDLTLYIKKLEDTLKSYHSENSTIRQIIKTDSINSTHISTDPMGIKGLKSQNLDVSRGNKGVSTDRQTDNSTDTSTHISTEKPKKTIDSNLREASEILNSLDKIKKDMRLRFKHLTQQEMLIFSTIYQFEDQGFDEISYKTISNHLKLSESSIRDYVQRIINKGISLKKEKLNNKKILLRVSPELKKIASLSTIIQLRDL